VPDPFPVPNPPSPNVGPGRWWSVLTAAVLAIVLVVAGVFAAMAWLP